MNFLWVQTEGKTINEILEECTDKEWKDNYLQIMIKSLLEKEAIEVSGFIRCGRQYVRQFKPRINKEEYYIRLAEEGGVDWPNFSKVVMAFTAKKTNDKSKLIAELEEIIKELENEDEQQEQNVPEENK